MGRADLAAEAAVAYVKNITQYLFGDTREIYEYLSQ